VKVDITFFDWVVIILLISGAILGYLSGFLKQLSGLLAIFGGFLVIRIYKDAFNHFLYSMESLSNYIFFVPLISTFFLFLIGFLGIKIIFRIVRSFIVGSKLKTFDKTMGLVFGFLKYLICILVFIYIVTAYEVPYLHNNIKTSKTVFYLKDIAYKFVQVMFN